MHLGMCYCICRDEMAMLINNYNTRDLQTFVALLNQAEADGVTDIRFVRQLVEDAIRRRRIKIGRVRKTKHPRQAKPVPCPSCGRGQLVGPYVLDGLRIMRCSVKCGYSEAVG